MPKKRVPRNVPKVPSHVPRLLPEFDEAFFKQTLTDLRQKLSTQKVQEAEILFQRIVFGLIAPNCKLTENKYNQYYEETLQLYNQIPPSVSVECLMSNFYSLPSTKVRFFNKEKAAIHILKGLDLSINFFGTMDLSKVSSGCQTSDCQTLVGCSLPAIYETFKKIISACDGIKEFDRKEIDKKLTELFSVTNKMAKSQEYAIFLEHQAYILAKSQKFQEALPVLYKSFYFFEKQKDQNAQVKCLHAVGLVHKKLENHDMAMTTFEHILLGFDPNALDDEGKRCRLNSQYEVATYCFEKELYQKSGQMFAEVHQRTQDYWDTIYQVENEGKWFEFAESIEDRCEGVFERIMKIDVDKMKKGKDHLMTNGENRCVKYIYILSISCKMFIAYNR